MLDSYFLWIQYHIFQGPRVGIPIKSDTWFQGPNPNPNPNPDPDPCNDTGSTASPVRSIKLRFLYGLLMSYTIRSASWITRFYSPSARSNLMVRIDRIHTQWERITIWIYCCCNRKYNSFAFSSSYRPCWLYLSVINCITGSITSSYRR